MTESRIVDVAIIGGGHNGLTCAAYLAAAGLDVLVLEKNEVNKYLGSAYRVFASYGHVRDLPSKNGSVLPDNDFEMHWDVDPKAAKRLAEIAKA
ncbi:MAG: FAD-dependent oxidoreductase, partial [Hyphomicrobium sp.]